MILKFAYYKKLKWKKITYYQPIKTIKSKLKKQYEIKRCHSNKGKHTILKTIYSRRRRRIVIVDIFGVTITEL